MNSETNSPTEPVDVLLGKLFDILLSSLARPAVWRQLLVIGLILMIAWLFAKGMEKWRSSHMASVQQESKWLRHFWEKDLYRLVAPILMLILLNLAILWFAQQNQPTGLLRRMQVLFWIWLLYRILLVILYARFGARIRTYHRWFLTPIFLVLTGTLILRTLPGEIALTSLTFHLGTITFTLNELFASLLVLYGLLVSGWFIEQLLDHTLPRRLNANPGVVNSIATLVRYTISGLGIVIALSILGFNASSLAIIAGGLSVGIGIGLQDLVANFVSGLILLFEQSLRPGDVIEVNGNISTVQQIGLRATTVSTLDNIEVIIPNTAFTTGQVTTFTKSAKRVRTVMAIGVSYNSDTGHVKQTVEETAKQHPMILENPAPQLMFRGFGDSSLNFELTIWVDEPNRIPRVKSDLYYMLFDALAEQGIKIPFPQRDLNLRGGWEQLRDPHEKP